MCMVSRRLTERQLFRKPRAASSRGCWCWAARRSRPSRGNTLLATSRHFENAKRESVLNL